MARDVTVREKTPFYKEQGGRLVLAGELVAGYPQKVGDEPIEGVMAKGRTLSVLPLLDEHGQLPKGSSARRYVAASILG